MKKPRIFVLRMKDVIKVGAAVLAGLVLVIALAVWLLPDRDSALNETGAFVERYIPGIYTASIILNDRPVNIHVTVDEHSITAIQMSELYESQRLLFPLFEPVMERVSDDILFYQTADIVIHNEHPVTTGILQSAVASALRQAALPAEAG